MKSFGRFLFSCAIVAAAIIACGDHVTVPNDKTGKCTAGLLTKCGDTCVDTQSDIANCGGCGMACGGAKVCVAGKCTDSCPPGSTKCGDVCSNTDVDRANCGMCGKACMANEVCAKGKCTASCEAAGYLTCPGMMGPVDAGGAMNCVNQDVDEKNCGTCGHACMMGEACTRGVCCTLGTFACNGTCVDLKGDSNNCGGCGDVCPMAAPTCVFGSCSKCNNTVLLLPDSQTSLNATIKSRLESNGFVVTLVDNGSATYNGMPAATTFGVVLIMRGLNTGNNVDMPMSGQQSIATAQSMSTGIVLDGYTALDITYPGYLKLQTLKTFALFSYVTATTTAGTLQNISSQFPFFAGIPSGFGTNTFLWYTGNVINNGTQDSQFLWSQTYVGGIHRSSPGGRIVQFPMVMNYQNGQSIWNPDPYMFTWVMNGLRWAAGCAN